MKYGKFLPVRISPHFDSNEFDCKCPCSTPTEIAPELLNRLNLLRDLCQEPIHIISGFRCDFEQAELKRRGYETAIGRSTHQDGRAADIRVIGTSGRELEHLARAVGFRAVGVASNWIHVDVRDDKDRSWTYKPVRGLK